MPEENLNSPQPSRPGRVKTQLACDVCRRRKSRCDGRRPACTHCVEAGVSCHYRTIVGNLESDAALLARFTAIEERMEALEEQMTRPEESQPIDDHVHRAQSPARPPAILPVSTSLIMIPPFHHGAGHKVLQYWSRLRVHLTIPNVDVLQFLKQAEYQDTQFTKGLAPELARVALPLSLANNCLRCWNEITSQLPIGFAVLLESSISFSNEHISSMLDLNSTDNNNNDEAPGPALSELALEDLLIYTIGLRWLLGEEAEMPKVCFTLALQNLWRVQMQADDVAIPYLLVVAHIFLYIYAMPYHALGMLQVADAAINSLSAHRDSRLFEAFGLISTQIFYLLQSDILSEIDGSPSIRTPPPLVDNGNVNSSTLTIHGQPSTFDYLSANLWLRSCLNKILAHMFITGQAYCQPREVSPSISEISMDIETWYRSLPLELQFVRDARSFRILSPFISTRIKELSLRYHACISILTRPVLYFVLYHDLENSVTPSPGSALAADRYLEPWVFALCSNCIESSKVIIMCLAKQLYPSSGGIESHTPFSTQDYHADPANGFAGSRNRYLTTWSDIQLLVGAYAVLLSVQTAPSFSSTFRDVTSIDELLDTAEQVLSSLETSCSLGYAKTLEILVNIRHNLRASTPGAAT